MTTSTKTQKEKECGCTYSRCSHHAYAVKHRMQLGQIPTHLIFSDRYLVLISYLCAMRALIRKLIESRTCSFYLGTKVHLPIPVIAAISESIVGHLSTAPNLTSNTDMSDIPTLELREKYRHFRILVIGRANAGKTTLLKRVCNTSEEPCIYDEENNNLVRFRLSSKEGIQ
jgi:hypothetical protein